MTRLAAHPTPHPDKFDFTFSSEDEQRAYVVFEQAHTTKYISALGAAISKQDREQAKEELAAARKRAYALWKERDVPVVGRLA